MRWCVHEKIAGETHRALFLHRLISQSAGTCTKNVAKPFESPFANTPDEVKTASGSAGLLRYDLSRETGEHLAVCTIDFFHALRCQSPGFAPIGENGAQQPLGIVVI